MVSKLKYCLLIAGASLLAACGGGGDEEIVVASTNPLPTTFTSGSSTSYSDPTAFINTAPPPAAVSSPSSGVTSTGNLSTRVFENTGASDVATATVTYTAPNGTVTVPVTGGNVVVTTNDGYDTNVVWSFVPTGGSSQGASGTIKADGNIGVYCENTVADTADQLFVSANMQQASSTSEIAAAIKGLSFREYKCNNNNAGTLAFNSDGTMTATPTGRSAQTFTASQVALLFGATGLDIGVGTSDEVILRLYKYTPSGTTTTRYFIGLFFNENGVKSTSFAYQLG